MRLLEIGPKSMGPWLCLARTIWKKKDESGQYFFKAPGYVVEQKRASSPNTGNCIHLSILTSFPGGSILCFLDPVWLGKMRHPLFCYDQ